MVLLALLRLLPSDSCILASDLALPASTSLLRTQAGPSRARGRNWHRNRQREPARCPGSHRVRYGTRQSRGRSPGRTHHTPARPALPPYPRSARTQRRPALCHAGTGHEHDRLAPLPATPRPTPEPRPKTAWSTDGGATASREYAPVLHPTPSLVAQVAPFPARRHGWHEPAPANAGRPRIPRGVQPSCPTPQIQGRRRGRRSKPLQNSVAPTILLSPNAGLRDRATARAAGTHELDEVATCWRRRLSRVSYLFLRA